MEHPARNAGGALGQYSYPAHPNGPAYKSRDRTTADLLKEIVGNVQEIIRSEVRLAKAEIREESSKGLSAAKLLGAGAVLSLYALGFVLLSSVYLLGTVVPPWAAALIVGVIVGTIAAALMLKGRAQFKKVSPKPEKTIGNVKENVAWIKGQTRS